MSYVTAALERHGVRYGVTGSHASSIYGETRFTNDIDIVVELDSQTLLNELLTDFPEGIFYVSDAGARRAVTHGGQFNIIHEDSSQKVDLIVPARSEWPDQLARRKKYRSTNGSEIFFVSAEDLILKKMDFYREGGSDKHLRDIASALRISPEKVDKAYIEEWADRLNLKTIWQAVLQRVVDEG